MIAVYKKFFLMLGVTVLLCLSASVVWSETIDDLVKRDGLYYKKFTEVPFTGDITGKIKGSFKNGKEEGTFVEYYKNGQLWTKGNYKNGKLDGFWIGYHFNGGLKFKGDYKNGKREGSWVWYIEDGTIDKRFNGTFKNGKKISD